MMNKRKRWGVDQFGLAMSSPLLESSRQNSMKLSLFYNWRNGDMILDEYDKSWSGMSQSSKYILTSSMIT
eukprot:scaffold12636_cov88-Skeletonema_menzelii.AAC.3